MAPTHRSSDVIRAGDYIGPDRRLVTTNGNGRDWTSLKAWAQAIGLIGIPGAISIWLVYVLGTEIPKVVQKLDVLIVETRLNREKIAEQIELTNTQIRIAQRTCSNSAKDDNARQKCFDK